MCLPKIDLFRTKVSVLPRNSRILLCLYVNFSSVIYHEQSIDLLCFRGFCSPIELTSIVIYGLTENVEELTIKTRPQQKPLTCK